MNYDSLSETILQDLKEEIAIINNPEIDPETRRYNLEIVLREVGEQAYEVVYQMNAWDMDIDYLNGKTINDAYYGLAKNISDSISVGGKSNIDAQIEEWLSNQILKAQYDAFWNAKEYGKFPTVTRTARANCCDWCREVVGTFVDPSGDVFRRHDRCKCEIMTSGWRTNNGLYSGERKAWKFQG